MNEKLLKELRGSVDHAIKLAQEAEDTNDVNLASKAILKLAGVVDELLKLEDEQ